MKRVFVVVGHPDDESLGCGATIAKHISQGDEMYCLVVANNYRSPKISEHFAKAMKVLGVKNYRLLNLPDSQLEKYTRMEVAQMVEEYVGEIGIPDVVYTHDADELSQDHRFTFWVAMTVFRPVWGKAISIYTFDSPSSSEWSPQLFHPNIFVAIKGFLGKKIEACKCYETEFRELPHPRSVESLEARARYWGMHCGLEYAEAFKVVREVK